MNHDFIEDLSERLAARVPSGLGGVGEELRQGFRAVLSGAFSHLDLVSREEFEIQTELLRRARAQLESLAQQVAELEVARKQSE